MLSYFKSFSAPKDPYEELEDIIYTREVNIQEVKKYIEILKSQNRIDKASSYGTLLTCAFIQRQYKIALLLLEAGSDPHFNSEGLTLIHCYILYGKFPQIRWLVWFGPDYKKILNSGKDKETAEERIHTWDWRLKNTNRLDIIKNSLDKIANDSMRVRELVKEAEKLNIEKNTFRLITIYQEIGKIYNEQYEVEKNLKLLDYTRHYKDRDYLFVEDQRKDEKDHEDFHQVSTYFYGSKAYFYYQKAEELLESLNKKNLFNADLQKQLLFVVEQILALSKVVGMSQQQIIEYANKAAVLKDTLEPTSFESRKEKYGLNHLVLESKEKKEADEIKESESEPLLGPLTGLRKRTTISQSVPPKASNRV